MSEFYGVTLEIVNLTIAIGENDGYPVANFEVVTGDGKTVAVMSVGLPGTTLEEEL